MEIFVRLEVRETNLLSAFNRFAGRARRFVVALTNEPQGRVFAIVGDQRYDLLPRTRSQALTSAVKKIFAATVYMGEFDG